MITLSVSATAEAVKQISDRHDADVIHWANDILENIEVFYYYPHVSHFNQFWCSKSWTGLR